MPQVCLCVCAYVLYVCVTDLLVYFLLGGRCNSQTRRSYTSNLECNKAAHINTGKVRHEFTVSTSVSVTFCLFVASLSPCCFRNISAVTAASRRPEALPARPEGLWCIHNDINYLQCLSLEPYWH